MYTAKQRTWEDAGMVTFITTAVGETIMKIMISRRTGDGANKHSREYSHFNYGNDLFPLSLAVGCCH